VILGVGGPYNGYVLYLTITPAGFASGTVRAWGTYGTYPPGVSQAPSPDGEINDFSFSVGTPTSLQVGQHVSFFVAQGKFSLYATEVIPQ
jgi:hypothetical protein